MDVSYVLDTNLLVYGFDENEPEKRNRALSVIETVGQRPSAALPVQVLAEFTNVTLYQLEPPLSPDEIATQIELYEEVFPVFPLTSAVVREAIRGVRDHSFSYFDAQIWATAKRNQVPTVLSEDFPVGATVEGVTFVNPLSEDVDLSGL